MSETSQLRITWGRVVALFAFAVRLSQEYCQVSYSMASPISM